MVPSMDFTLATSFEGQTGLGESREGEPIAKRSCIQVFSAESLSPGAEMKAFLEATRGGNSEGDRRTGAMQIFEDSLNLSPEELACAVGALGALVEVTNFELSVGVGPREGGIADP